jgi:hypothetical protein
MDDEDIWLEEEEYAFEEEMFLRKEKQNESQIYCKRSFKSSECV